MSETAFQKRVAILSRLGVTAWALRPNKRAPLHLLVFKSELIAGTRICLIQNRSELYENSRKKFGSIIENAMRAINFFKESEKFLPLSTQASNSDISCTSALTEELLRISPGVVFICDQSIISYMVTNNLKDFGIGEDCVLDKVDIPVVEIPTPNVLLTDFREKRRFWRQLVKIKSFLLEVKR